MGRHSLAGRHGQTGVFWVATPGLALLSILCSTTNTTQHTVGDNQPNENQKKIFKSSESKILSGSWLCVEFYEFDMFNICGSCKNLMAVTWKNFTVIL